MNREAAIKVVEESSICTEYKELLMRVINAAFEYTAPPVSEFKVGDIVKAVKAVGNRPDIIFSLIGKYGRVVNIDASIVPIGVDFFEPFDGSHSCFGKAKNGRWGNPDQFELVYRPESK